MYKPLIQSIGIEIEFANLPKDLLRSGTILSHNWRLVEDGSCRSHHRTYDGLFKTEGPEGTSVMFGGELVSPILDVTQDGWDKDMYEILTTLYEWGEGIDARTSIHIHVNSSGLPVYALKYLFKIGAYLEDALYRLSIAEADVHRGEVLHDYGYCRPITSDGPPVTACYDGAYRPIYTLDNLLQADSVTEFQLACGRFDRHGGKYHEARYTWLNPLAIFHHGSMEFRLWNMTRYPQYVLAWIHICMAMVRESLGKQSDLPTNPLGCGNIGLDGVVDFLQLDDPIVYILEELWEEGRQCAPIRNAQLGHLGHEINWSRTPDKLVPLPVGRPVEFSHYDQGSSYLIKEGFTILPYLDDEEEPKVVQPRVREDPHETYERVRRSISEGRVTSGVEGVEWASTSTVNWDI